MAPTWMAFHIFYASDSNPIITECVKPFVDRKRADGELARWFFIKYWMEGPHLRVRLLPAPGVDPEKLRAEFLAEVKEFLRHRPALYDAKFEGVEELYTKMFLAEYGQDEWDRRYGRDGSMPFRDNNSVHEFEYEPECGRYGGPVGMEIGEWHFEQSSDTVAELLSQANTHVRPTLLGLTTQLTLMLAYAFLESDAAVARFFQRYRSFWETTYQEPSDDYHENFEKSLKLTEDGLRDRIARVKEALTAPVDDLGHLERTWLAHCQELKARVLEAAPRMDFGGRTIPVDTPDDYEGLAAVVLSSYIHMTNNRLGSAILDEIYLSYLIERVTQPVEASSVP